LFSNTLRVIVEKRRTMDNVSLILINFYLDFLTDSDIIILSAKSLSRTGSLS